MVTAAKQFDLANIKREFLGPSLLETRLPYRELSIIAKADRRNVDPVYAAHRWWARRPPGVIRGLLLAACLPDETTTAEFWNKFAEPSHHLEGVQIHDMFAGGGAMLVEAARLGAIPSGTDVDPLAVEIIRHELGPPSEPELRRIADGLLANLTRAFQHLYPGKSKQWVPLHYFFLHRVTCPACSVEGLLYRNLILARDIGKHGSVVRDTRVIAFCPQCKRVHAIRRRDQKNLRCCTKRRLDQGTYKNGRYTCPNCGERFTHADLQTGAAERTLLAVEETSRVYHRRIRAAAHCDKVALRSAADLLKRRCKQLAYPTTPLASDRVDARPVSFGMTRADQLFTARQLIVFGSAFAQLNEQGNDDLNRALRLAFSSALATNNRLCSYATDYGRIAPLFSVRSYSLPWLAVELNPLHPTAGRGTLKKALEKIVSSTSEQVRRYVWNCQKNRAETKNLLLRRSGVAGSIRCASALEPLPPSRLDLCLFDPPYFDYIAYSELSEFFRSWNMLHSLGGRPLLPEGETPVQSFGGQLGLCLRNVLQRLRPGRPLAFTFHSLQQDAWIAIGMALDAAELKVTGIWPVLNDSHMGHHGTAGNCEWDLVVACRRSGECQSSNISADLIDEWICQVKPLRIRRADRRCMNMALTVLGPKYGRAMEKYT